MRILYLFLFLMVSLIVMGQNTYEERIQNLKNIPDKSLTDSVKVILFNLSLERRETEMSGTRAMLAMDDILKGENYFLVMRHYAKIAPSNNQALIDSCMRFARNNNLGSYVSSLYVLKSTFFKTAFIYDSAMIYTLRARDEAIEYDNVEQKANVLHLLGDLYFGTGLFPKAKRYYEEVQEVKGKAEVWDSWRRRVIRNNLGLIAMKEVKYNMALRLFDESRKEIGNQLDTKFDSLSLAYIFLVKAQALFHLKDYQKTNAYIDSSLSISEKTEDHSGLFYLYVLRARLCLINNDAKSALKYIGYANNFADAAPITQAERNEILLLQSNIYVALGEPNKAMAYLNSYAIANDSLFKEFKFAQISQIQAENEYELFKIKYEDLRTERTIYFLFGIAAIVVISIISLLYFRIRLKNKRLVALAIESAGRQNNLNHKQPSVIGKTEGAIVSHSSDIHYQQLAAECARLIETEKLFLQKDLSLQNVAELLGTNRTYLSKAINLELKQNFSTYINSLRIKEAIRILSDSKSAKYNINGLSTEVGFGGRASYVSSFMKHTGMLPSTFINNYEKILKDSIIPIKNQDL